MTVTLPETLTYGKVVGRFVLAIGDEPTDPDVIPNAVAAQGQISFTKALSITKETQADPPTAVIRSIIPAAIDNNGFLYNPKDPTGPRGIWLVTGVYKVSYSLNTGAIEGHDILVLPEHTIENPMDLINYMRPGGPVLTASQYAELSARIETKLPEIFWDGTRLSVDGEVSPSLVGPPSTVPGPPNVLSKGSVSTGEPGSSADFSISGTAPNQTLDLTIPRGDVGPPNVLSKGTVITGEPGTDADFTITGEAPNQTLSLVVPRGDPSTVPGPPNVLTVGTVTTVSPATPASVTITGESPEQVLNLELPKGDPGGIVSPSLLPNGGSIDDLTSGLYHAQYAGSIAVGYPVEGFLGYLMVGSRSSSYRFQVAYSSQQTSRGTVWVRVRSNSTTWHPWVLQHATGAIGGGDLTGTGMPNGVFTAPIGVYYTDLARTNGALRWYKQSGSGNTGWECIVGDTGWRDISGGLTAEWVAYVGFGVRVRRINETVTMRVHIAAPAESQGVPLSGLWRDILPTGGLALGFRPLVPLWSDQPIGDLWYGGTNRWLLRNGANGKLSVTSLNTSGSLSSARVGGEVSWLTLDNWPTTLPGTAV